MSDVEILNLNAPNPEAQKGLERWRRFAERNNLELATWCPLAMRAQQVVDRNGACPCHPDTRPHCPCKECIEECQRDGECSCRVFVAPDWEERWKKKWAM